MWAFLVIIAGSVFGTLYLMAGILLMHHFKGSSTFLADYVIFGVVCVTFIGAWFANRYNEY